MGYTASQGLRPTQLLCFHAASQQPSCFPSLSLNIYIMYTCIIFKRLQVKTIPGRILAPILHFFRMNRSEPGLWASQDDSGRSGKPRRPCASAGGEQREPVQGCPQPCVRGSRRAQAPCMELRCVPAERGLQAAGGA